ncbi:MAG TPA: hypothetical protein VFJ43_01420 [Bacteroidia bacterium]|nr:hypothetical protein [Bacteroidia bacterium]
MNWAPDAHNDAGFSSDATSLSLKEIVFGGIEGFWIAYALYFPVIILCGSFFSKYLHRYISITLVILSSIAAMLSTLFTLVAMDLSNMFDKVNYHWTCYVLIGFEIFFEIVVLLFLTKWFKTVREKILK